MTPQEALVRAVEGCSNMKVPGLAGMVGPMPVPGSMPIELPISPFPTPSYVPPPIFPLSSPSPQIVIMPVFIWVGGT